MFSESYPHPVTAVRTYTSIYMYAKCNDLQQPQLKTEKFV
jgi:hypothetical protein